MSWFPQIGAGSVAQFPLRRTRRWRSISNQLESNERILLPDRTAGEIAWDLTFRDLTDTEIQKLSGLFTASQGRFLPFSFIDPMANLLGWSEDLTRPDWQHGLLSMQAGAADPSGGNRAWSIANASPGMQALEQTRETPGEYVACFSAWIRSAAPATVILRRDGLQTTASAGPAWRRFMVAGAGTSGAIQSTCSINIGAGQAIEVWGLQLEAQPCPSGYKKTTIASGIYEETWFGMDELTITSTGPGLSSCRIALSTRI
jgi:hypothetical protein